MVQYTRGTCITKITKCVIKILKFKFCRTSALLSRGAMNWEDRPIWYDIYEAFPPKDEPRFDRPAPNLKLKPILYKEDKVRA